MRQSRLLLFYCMPTLILLLTSCEKESNSDLLEESGASLVVVSGNNQKGEFGQKLADSIIVSIVDRNQNPIRNIELQFAVISGGGTISQNSVIFKITGKASLSWILGRGTEQIL